MAAPGVRQTPRCRAHRLDGGTVPRVCGYAGTSMTQEEARAYVKQWAETGRWLESVRWRELRALDEARAQQASASLIAAALLVPLPDSRRYGSGLIDQQDLFHPRRS